MTVTRDTVREVLAAVKKLTGRQVLVGIPEDKTERVNGDEATNAQLGYVHEFGSPANNIPARPFLIPGTEKVLDRATEELSMAADATMDGNSRKATQHLVAAGLIAEDGAKNEISTADYVPLSPATVRERYKSRNAMNPRSSESKYLQLVAGGMDPAEAQAAVGIRPLINTGQLRDAITSVVRKVDQ